MKKLKHYKLEGIGLLQNRHYERLKGAWQSRKNNAKIIKLVFFTGLLRKNFHFFLAMTKTISYINDITKTTAYEAKS